MDAWKGSAASAQQVVQGSDPGISNTGWNKRKEASSMKHTWLAGSLPHVPPPLPLQK